ncbi:hypothetical protein TNCV_792681 [Trichonephila clavipes]|nr:hypothetical protein TNCV_792681 [Trichonephila clavipes]
MLRNEAILTSPPLSKDYVEVFFIDVNSVMWWSSVILIPHEATQRRRNKCCVKKFEQELLQEDQICPTV